MIVDKSLLERIMYCLEDTQSTRQFWLDIEQGQLRELYPEQLEAQPERFGEVLFPLPPWSSVQGYELLRDFAHNIESDIESAPDSALTEKNELQKILRSRHQVFKRYRAYLKQNLALKRTFENFKAQYFCRYLFVWYKKEFPQANKLPAFLQQVEAGCSLQKFGEFVPYSADGEHVLQESGASANLLREDFVVVEELRESAENFQCLSALDCEWRALRLLALKPEENLNFSDSFTELHGLYREVPWFNFLELQSPTEEAIAALYWVWESAAHRTEGTGKRVRIVRLLCDEKYEQLAINDYLIQDFLSRICPKFGIASLELCLDTAQSEVLKGLPVEIVAEICTLSLVSAN